jgi:AAA+ ATPase superfamily predicted ATPase
MKSFIDREKATEDINTLLREKTAPWMVLSGGRKIGKTEFAKKIANMNDNFIFCDPRFETMYACALIQSLTLAYNPKLETAIYEFAKLDSSARNIYKSLGFTYVSPLKKVQLKSLIRILIKNDISSGLYSFAHYLGETLDVQVDCIFLDDFHNCDFDSYSWILEFWNALSEPHPTIVAICNFELSWESCTLLNTFHSITAPINIDKFDSSTAFYDIIKEHFVFESNVNLSTISEQLFTLFEGSSRLLFETIELLDGKTSLYNDEKKMIQILNMAYQIKARHFNGFNKSHMLVIRLLAYSPTPISKNTIIDILDLIEPMASDIISTLYDSNFITQTANNETGITLYRISDNFLIELIKSGCSENEQLFYKTKIYRAIQSKQISANLEQIVNLAIELGENEAEDLVLQYIRQPEDSVPDEKKANYIDKLLHSIEHVPKSVTSVDIAQLLYTYGYYQSAQKVMNCLTIDNNMLNYNYLLLLGDIQHVLLSPKASHTYMQASKITGITISDKLKALNREIMALNQEHKEILAKNLYIETFAKYESVQCAGLVELYRNSNNSFEYNAAMEYTIKGYLLAEKLGENLEIIKCLHNICMLLLQYGRYGQPMKDNPLGFEPNFEQVLTFFAKHPEYRHEQAYPLLDLGTVKMFEYTDNDDVNLLVDAKKYYSEAQLYAKSFYARYIAETGLLVVNSYLYANLESSFISNAREKLFKRYTQQKASIEDYRVHRKILLSLAVSAIISKEIQEAVDYLKQAHPYIEGPETNRYNKLCQKAKCTEYIKDAVSLSGKYEKYYASDKFVPWLISLCH